MKEEQLDQALRDLGASMRQRQAPARVEAALLEAYRNRQRRWSMGPVWALASAAAVVLAVVIVMAPERAVEQPAARAVTPVLVTPAAVMAVAEPKKVAPAPRNQRTEIVTDFFRVRNGPIFEDDMSQLVRVRLPRETLTRYGLPGGQDGPESTVRADVLLGRDGMAHAIRFVR